MSSTDTNPAAATTDSTATQERHGFERRSSPRYTVQVKIEVRPEGSEANMALTTTDLSRGGCYIQLENQLPLGARVGVTLWLDSYQVVIKAIVVTRHPEFGNGIMFLEFEQDGERRLIRYIDAINVEG